MLQTYFLQTRRSEARETISALLNIHWKQNRPTSRRVSEHTVTAKKGTGPGMTDARRSKSRERLGVVMNTGLAVAEGETRQAMMRVWMAISAIWVAFWLSMAALIAVAAEMTVPLAGNLGLFALIVLSPPIALLAVGTALRWGFEMLFQKSKATVRQSQ
jgi:hypothetical protein